MFDLRWTNLKIEADLVDRVGKSDKVSDVKVWGGLLSYMKNIIAIVTSSQTYVKGRVCRFNNLYYMIYHFNISVKYRDIYQIYPIVMATD